MAERPTISRQRPWYVDPRDPAAPEAPGVLEQVHQTRLSTGRGGVSASLSSITPTS